jgi:hypothetical protein
MYRKFYVPLNVCTTSVFRVLEFFLVKSLVLLSLLGNFINVRCNLKKIILLIFIILNISSCRPTPFPDASKRFNGFLSYFLGIENKLNNASIQLTGTLTDTSDTPLVNYSLNTTFNYFRQATDKMGTTSETGFFSLNLSPGVFTINIIDPLGNDFGYFDVQLIDSETDPVILSANGNFRISGLTAQPILGECASLCGDLMAINTGKNDENLLLIAQESDKALLLISNDGAKSFTRHPISIPNCTPTNNSVEIIGCRLFFAGYDGVNYLVLAGKTVCTFSAPGSPCMNSNIVLYMGVSQNPSNIILFEPPFSSQYQFYYFFSFPDSPMLFVNNLLFMQYPSTGGTLIIDTSGNAISLFPESCSSIFLNSNTNQVWCDLKFYFDESSKTWISTNFTQYTPYKTAFLGNTFKTVEMIYNQSGVFNFEFASYDLSLNKTKLSELIVNQTNVSNPTVLRKAGLVYKSMYPKYIPDPTDPYKTTTKLYQLKSIDGLNYTNSYIRFPTSSGDVTAITGFIAHKDKFYITGILGSDFSQLKSYLLVANSQLTESKWRVIPVR